MIPEARGNEGRVRATRAAVSSLWRTKDTLRRHRKTSNEPQSAALVKGGEETNETAALNWPDEQACSMCVLEEELIPGRSC